MDNRSKRLRMYHKQYFLNQNLYFLYQGLLYLKIHLYNHMMIIHNRMTRRRLLIL